MSKLLIFDADSMVFTVAWRFRTKKAEKLVKLNTNKFISDVLRNANADDYIGFFGAKNPDKPNFRYSVYSKYKANRPATPDFVVKWGPTIRNEFEDTWGFLPVEGMEADDAVAMTVEKHRNDYDEIIVATFDKDLKTIPDITFYNMKTHKMENISKIEATKNFYIQMLMGDPGDNIPGIKGVGKAGANKILKDCNSEFSMFMATVRKYKSVADKIANTELSKIRKQVEDDIKNPEVDTTGSPYKGLKGAKLERKIRINSKKQIRDLIDEVMPGGWKAYYKQQYQLLRLLTKENDDISIPDAQENPVKSSSDVTAEEAKQAVFGDDMDDFLTV